MSIVGPRPHAVAHNEEYRKLIKAYMVRHKVKPGITGWAQVNGHRGETDTIEKMQARVEYDLEYLRNWSLALDLADHHLRTMTAGVLRPPCLLIDKARVPSRCPVSCRDSDHARLPTCERCAVWPHCHRWLSHCSPQAVGADRPKQIRHPYYIGAS